MVTTELRKTRMEICHLFQIEFKMKSSQNLRRRDSSEENRRGDEFMLCVVVSLLARLNRLVDLHIFKERGEDYVLVLK